MVETTYLDELLAGFKKHWDLNAFSNYQESPITYGEAAQEIIRLHYIFEQCGLQRGSKVALAGRNSTNWVLTYLAAVTYGGVIVPILPDFHTDDISHIVRHSDAELLFAADSIYEKMDDEKLPNVKGILSLEHFTELFSRDVDLKQIIAQSKTESLKKFDGELTADNLKFADMDNEEMAAIIYTSGTTGFSKGVMLPHRSIISNVLFISSILPTKAGDTILSFLPLAHVYGCAVDFLQPVTIGAHIHFLGKMPSPKVLVEAFQAVKPRVIVSVPLILEKMYRKRIKPKISTGAPKTMLKLPVLNGVVKKKILNTLNETFGGNFWELVIGGAGLNQEVESFLRDIKFRVTNGYGMTECGPLISYAPTDENRMAAVGRAVDRMEIRIDSEDQTKIVGEILTKGDNLMLGYYKNKEATKEVIDEDGWLHTGDMGVLDEDGFLYIKGRCKSMLLGPAGENIYPEEIEAELNNLPYVGESLVLQHNNQLVALVHADMDAADTAGLDEKAIEAEMEKNRQTLNTANAAYKKVVKIKLYPEEFEKTPTKKVKRFLYEFQG